MNDQLSCPYSTDDIFLAVKQMHPMKASSPDGLPPLFFQKYWGFIGDDIVSLVQHVLHRVGSQLA